jgi:hypothetical protein
MTRPLTIDERRSLASFKGWRTRRKAMQAEALCPGCGERITGSVVEHLKRRHVDLYQRRARKHGDLI